MGDLSVSIAAELVKFMLVSLKEVISERAHLISDAKNQVEMLEKNILLLKEFLVDSTKLRATDILIRGLIRDIRDGVYEVEDAIDSFVIATEGKGLIGKVLSIRGKVLSMAKQIQDVGQKVNSLSTEVKKHIEKNRHKAAQDEGLEEYDEDPSPRQDNVMVGFEDEERELIRRLTTETEQLDVICIIGTPGLGKTRLAANIFHHPTIQDEDKFSIRIWVSVSNSTIKKVFLTILRKLGKLKKGIHHRSDAELGNIVAGHLEHEKYLIVMDDVWTAGGWKKLQVGFPKGHKKGKVLITSCHQEVARVNTIHPDRPHTMLRKLTQQEGWHLLQSLVFGNRKCPQELECFGKLIVEQCDRLPMAIVDIADILARRVSESDGMITMKDAWEQVCDSMGTVLNEDQRISGKNKLLSRYDELPFHLRACFLYLGMFPEGYEIPVSTLIRMWIAEGFVQRQDELSLEETAGNYLDQLISRNLVSVGKRKPNGRPKPALFITCYAISAKLKLGKKERIFCKN